MGECDPRVDDARRRWRAAGDRLWPVALSDGESYRAAAEAVGALVGMLRERARTLEDLVELETAHGSDARPDLLAAACAVRADELAAERARWERATAIGRARADGVPWVLLDESPTRVVEMHVATGAALVATADPYLGAEPFTIVELTLDATTGEPVPGAAGEEVAFAERDAWSGELARRREALDTRVPDGSDT